MADFLLEIGTEEIPARMIDGAREELSRRVTDLLTRERLVDSVSVDAISTPRRIAVLARNVAMRQRDVEEQIMGPAASAAEKNPKALEAFAKKAGVDVSEIQRVSTPKGEYLAATLVKKGRGANAILTESLPKEIAGLYWAKNMYWREGKPERFVRPVRWLVALLGGEIVPVEFAGIVATAETRGHRLLVDKQVRVDKAELYTEALGRAKVLTQVERERVIRKALDNVTRTIAGARWRDDDELLRKVINLTEFPSVILGSFDREYLTLPEEVLVTVMRDHQNYFAVEDAKGKLAPCFLAVLNTSGDPEGIIRHGHERVLRARFNDARFFWNTDQKIPLTERVEMLKAVTFQKDLGSYHAKTERVTKLAVQVAAQFRGVDVKAVETASRLSKTDLTAELVKEFTELQGIIGGLYARHQKLGEPVAAAIYDQYKPQSMEDDVPRSAEGAVLGIADKADSIAGMFLLGLIPSGSKDPFALRRQANGIVKTIAEHKVSLLLSDLFRGARENYRGSEAEKKFSTKINFDDAVAAFFRERLEFYLRDVRGFAYDVVNAVLAAGSDDVLDALSRAEAVTRVRGTENFEPIAAAFKRIKNILRQAAEKKLEVAASIDESALQQDEEQLLARESKGVAASVKQLRADHDYEQALLEISKLRPTVDVFFDKVMVMVDDERVRANRLALLQSLHSEFSTIADFSEIVTQ